jgi:putative endonuclease
MNKREYCVYILTNKNHTTLYTGVTNNLVRRVFEHKNHIIKGFSDKYNLEYLVFYEVTNDIQVAILREKQIKGGSRKKKIELINNLNPEWQDLFEDISLR